MTGLATGVCFSALQRAEIAEIKVRRQPIPFAVGFSALQRAEIAEMDNGRAWNDYTTSFSALQRAEIAEIARVKRRLNLRRTVSVLFNEPKLLKGYAEQPGVHACACFSALQRAEIAEIAARRVPAICL